MYDLNLSVPNLSTSKFSNDEKFYLLKNYLYELNETLSFTLSNLELSNFSDGLKANIESVGKNKTEINNLKDDALKKFTELKNKIIITADEVFQECNTEIEKSEKEILLKADGSYLAKSEFGEYKNQTATVIQANSEAIKLNADNIETTSNDLENYKSQNNAELSVQATAIMAQVENMFTKKSEHDEFTEAVSSQITQTAENITEIFSQKLEDTNADISSLGGTVSELVYSLNSYIKRGELESGVYGIEIGRSDSNIKARFTNDKLSFFQGDVEVAFISGNNLYITRAEITDYLKLGDSNNGYFIFDVSNNGLEVKWSYGS